MLFWNLEFLSNVGLVFLIFGDLVYIICIGIYIYCFWLIILFSIKLLVKDCLMEFIDWWLLWCNDLFFDRWEMLCLNWVWIFLICILVVWIFGVIGVIFNLFFWFWIFFNGVVWNFFFVGIGLVVLVIICFLFFLNVLVLLLNVNVVDGVVVGWLCDM